MNRIKKLIVVAPVLFLILCSLSQSVSFSDEQLLVQYNKAEGFYKQATELGLSPRYSEDKESELNHEALVAYGIFLKNLSANNKRLDSLKYQAAFKSGELQHYFGHFPEAITGYSLAIKTVRQSSLPDSLLFKPYLFSGILYYGKNNFDSAAFCFQKAEIILKKHKYQLSEKERLYNAYGVLQYERGDYRQAKNYFLKAIETLSKDHAYGQELLTNYEVNLAQIYFKLEDYDQANKMYQELSRKKIHTNEINHNLGLINLYLGAASRSLEYFRKVDYRSNKIIWLYTNMGEAFLNLKEFDSSRHYLQKAIAESKHYGTNTDHYALGMALHHYGNLELALDKPGQALEWYQQAINHLYPGFKNPLLSANPNKFSGVFSYVNLFHALTQKAAALHQLYLAKNQLSYAQQELEVFQSAFALADYVSHTYESDEARLFLNKIKYIVHSRPIDIAYELYQKTKNRKYLEDLYQLDQQNKASVLSIRIHASDLFSDTSSSRERQVKSEISRLSIKASHSTDSVQIARIGKEIRDLEIELGGISDSLEQKNQVSNSIPTITALQNNLLDPGTALASFHLSENKITRIWITRNEFEVNQQELPANFYEDVAAYVAALKTPSNPLQQTGLFNLLFKDLGFNKLQQLIIIPDDELNYLPFETLQDHEGRYLIENCAVQYQYTTALLKKEKLNFSDYETLAMAPYARKGYHDSSMELPSLPHSLEEVRLLKGKHLYDSNATKRNFLNELNKFKVLHLATHALVNTHENELSYISFAPDSLKENFLLYAEEIYHLPMHKTDLVILSACETGGGLLVRGEGIMSLSRAFAYAGCSNIITSLWVANDFSTAWLMRRLHVYLDKNYTVDQALQQAKLDYLKDEKINPRLKHPFYWSHLVFVGNHETIRNGPDYRLMLVALLAAVGLFVLVHNFRRKWISSSSNG